MRREYWLTQALGERLAPLAHPTVLYDVDGELLDLGGVVDRGLDLCEGRVLVGWEDGLVAAVNQSGGRRLVLRSTSFGHRPHCGGSYAARDPATGALTPLLWDPAGRVWRDATGAVAAWEVTAQPSADADVAWVWTAPEAGTASVTAVAADPDAGCGDGVEVRILHGAAELAAATLAPGGDPVRLEAAAPLGAGERVVVALGSRGDAACDATDLEALVDFVPDAESVWTVPTAFGEVELPPHGWVVWAPDFLALSGRVGGRRLDAVAAPRYVYLAARDGAPVTYGPAATDGAFARVPGPWGDDLHLAAGTFARWEGRELLRVSPAADVNLRLEGERTAMVGVHGPAGTAAGAHVVWGGLPAAWAGRLRTGRGAARVVPLDHDGRPAGPPRRARLVGTGGGEPALDLGWLEAERRYRVALAASRRAAGRARPRTAPGGASTASRRRR